jgi:hypothetical protein
MNSSSTRKLPRISDFSPEEVTPAVLVLLEFCHDRQEQIQALRDEVARLKGQKPRPSNPPPSENPRCAIADGRVDGFLWLFRIVFVFAVSDWFPVGATISSPCSHGRHTPHRTVLALFTHTAPQQHASPRK